MYNDKNLTCADCGQEFVFTASEQDFYAQRGFTEPRRCPSCRASRKAARNADGGGGSSYGGYGAGGGYSPVAATAAVATVAAAAAAAAATDRGPREMFTATCSSCGKDAQVPFRPTSGKPVYCSDCFRSQRGAYTYSSRRGSGAGPAEPPARSRPGLSADPGRSMSGAFVPPTRGYPHFRPVFAT